MDYSSVREFFRGDFDLKELLRIVYGLNYIEMETFELLMEVKKADVALLMNKLGRKDRVLVNRCLTTLRKNGLVNRHKESEGGKRGYWYVYSVIDIGEMKSNLIDKLDTWYKKALAEIEKLEEFVTKKRGKEFNDQSEP